MSKGDKKGILQRDLSKKEILIGLSSLLVFLIYIFVFMYPKYSQFKQANDTLKDFNYKKVEIQKKINTFDTKKEKVKQLEKELESKSRVLNCNIEDGMFLIGLSKAIKNQEVELVDYTVNAVSKYDNFYMLPITIQLRGNYEKVKRIIHYLENQDNMTQILDFDIQTYEEKQKEESTDKENTNKTIVPDSIVYFTNSGIVYHKKDCPMLQLEAGQTGEAIQEAEVDKCSKVAADENCKPYTVIEEDKVSGETQEKPKSEGDVLVTLNFVSYSSKNANLEFNNDDPTTWKPGKFNPFKTTSR